MATIKTDLICNLNQPVNVTYLHGNLFSQDNAGNTINVFVMDNGEPATIGGTVSANVIRSDGQTVAVSGAIEGNKAYVILPQACYAVPGVVHIIIKLTQNTTVTTIAAIVANVYMSTTDSVIDPGQVIPSIQALMALIEEAVDSIPTDYTGLLHTIAADYSSSKTYKVGDYAWESGVLKRCIVPITAAETYTAAHWTNAVIGDDLSALKSAFIKDIDRLTAQKTLPIFETGSITANAGSNTNSSARLRTTTYIESRVFGAVALPGYEFNVYAYSSGTYIGCLQTDGTLGKTSSVKYVTSYNFEDSYDYRLVLRKTGGADITIDEYVNVLFMLATDDSLSKADKAADAKVVGDKLNYIDSEIINIIHGEPNIEVDRYNGVDWMEIGAINSSGADLARVDSYRSGFLPCYVGSVIKSEMTLTSTTGLSYYHYVYFYDSSKNYISDSRVGGSKKLSVEASAPTNAAYYRVSLTYVTVGNVSTYLLTNTLNNANAATPKTKWYVLGDSISAGYYSMTESMAEAAGVTLDYTSPVTTPGGETTGSVWDRTLGHNYWGYANEWFLHQELTGLAIPGQGYFHIATYNDKNGVNVVDDNSFADAGMITVAWGFNDWHYNMQRGDHTLIDPSVPVPTDSYDTTQIETINHAIWYCLGRLIQKAPTAKIVVQTPMNGWAYGGDFSTNWGIGYAQSQSGTIKDIHDDIVYWCDYYGLQYIDMTFNNSVVNRVNIKDTIIDGSHPSDQAHKLLARTVYPKIGY